MTLDPNTNDAGERSHVVRDVYWQAGFDDGAIGQTWMEHRRVLQAQAEHDKAAEIAGIEQRLETARAELAIVKDEVQRDGKDFDRLATQLHDATRDRDRSPNQYSRPMGWSFILLAVAISMADFPLSQAISVQILNERAAEWFSHANFVALGIVAMGLFFKIMADPFTRPRYMLPPYLRAMSWAVTAALGVALAIALASVLGMLGIFRGEALTANSDDQFETKVYGTENTSTAPPATTAGSPGVLRREIESLEIGLVAKVAFLSLALVLPILGGIFLSTGAARLHNAKHIDRLQRLYPERRRAYEEIARKQHGAIATIATLERERAAAWSRPTLANSRYHSYLHGYERGLCTAPPGPGIAHDVRAFVGRWLTAARQRESMLRTQAVAASHSDFDDSGSTP